MSGRPKSAPTTTKSSLLPWIVCAVLVVINAYLFSKVISSPTTQFQPIERLPEQTRKNQEEESKLLAKLTELESEKHALLLQTTALKQNASLLEAELQQLKEVSAPAPLAPPRNTTNKLKYTTDDIVCGVITTFKYHHTRAKSVKETWGKRCGVTLFFSAHPDNYLQPVVLPGSEEGTIINEKVFGMFKYVWEHHTDKKWFIKADDDTYLHFDNILDMLSEYDHNEDLYVGRAGEWGGAGPQGGGGGPNYVRYCGGGAGYILSQKTLSKWYPSIDKCERLRVGEDVSVGKCLRDKANVRPTFKTGFYHKTPHFFFTNPIGQRDHPEGLSPRPLSFHSVQPEQMYEIDYLAYYVNTPLPAEGQWANPWPEGHPTH